MEKELVFVRMPCRFDRRERKHTEPPLHIGGKFAKVAFDSGMHPALEPRLRQTKPCAFGNTIPRPTLKLPRFPDGIIIRRAIQILSKLINVEDFQRAAQ